jgi:ABC-type transport system substrate-binding protein
VFPLEEDGPPIIGTGPFMATENIYQEWIIGDHITLIRNPDYHWGVERNMYVNFDKIIMYFYDDAYELNLALQIGQVDIAALPPYTYSALKDSVQGGSVSDIHCQDGLKCTQYWTEIGFCMNEDGGRNKARLDPEVRKALAMAIDKDVIVNTYYAGLAEPGTTLISSVNEEWHYEPTAEELIPYDLDGARQLLEDAGYRDTNADGIREVTADSLTYDMGWEVVGEPLSFEMLIRHEFPEEGEIANYLRDQWYSIGVDLEYDIYDEVTFSAIVYSYDYDSMIWYWSADPDPNFMLFGQAAQSIDGWSDNMYDNPDYQENYMLSITTMDPVDRKVYTDNCQRIAYEDCAYILLAYVYQTYAWRTDTFEGWGDWDANPCLSLDHFWTGPQLMFELEPIGESPPNTTSEVDGVVGQNGWYRSNVTVTLEATDGSGSFNRTLYSLDDSDWLTYEDPIEVTGDGEHVLMYYSVDDDGLTEPNNTLDLNIDTVDPSLTIDVSEGTTFDTDEVNISWESSDEGSGIAITEYLLDGEEYVPCADCYVVLTDLEEGEHNLTVRVHDEAGNNVSDTVQFVVDIPDEGMSTLAIAAAVSAAAVLGAAAFVYWTGRRKRGPLSPD